MSRGALAVPVTRVRDAGFDEASRHPRKSMVPRFVRSTLVGVAFAGAAAGCTSATGPDAVAGTYQMQRYEGQPLPARFLETTAGVVSVWEERIVLGDDGRGVSTTVYQEVTSATPGVGRLFSVTHGLDYIVRGRRVEITYDCPSLSSFLSPSCSAGPHLTGERTGAGLALGRPVSSKPASMYGRVR